jgi:hypothetical protein
MHTFLWVWFQGPPGTQENLLGIAKQTIKRELAEHSAGVSALVSGGSVGRQNTKLTAQR